VGKERIDLLLVRRGLVPSRVWAQSLLMAGVVFVEGTRVDKAGTLVARDSKIIIKEDSRRYVGRGGVKLEAALDRFKINVNDRVALDIGASTGGFTDCLLQFGARKVYAIDVGHGQIDWGLRQDKRVVVMEKVNARYLKPEDIGELVDIATIDVSFISLTLIIPRVKNLLKPKGMLIALIKPQFEVGKGEVGKKGVVRDESKYAVVIEKITSFLKGEYFDIIGVMPSPILGAEGNKEFLVAGVKN
jgi:23S rRNA (cytidine1920-2'-O)/16S rRNA (cytidine1409-2'-O)-methyltransferase